MKKVNSFRYSVLSASIAFLGSAGCAPQINEHPAIPALDYARRIGRGENQDESFGKREAEREAFSLRKMIHGESPQEMRARLRYAADGSEQPQFAPVAGTDQGYRVEHSSNADGRDYNGPLSLGDPGLSSSLWQESRGNTDLFHDHRAWQPMDLITIVITEKSEGKKEATTDVSSESTFKAAIENFFGYENDVKNSNQDVNGTTVTPTIDLSNLINATTETEFKGDGETERKGSLKGTISAMVSEVLPSGVLRISGEKIIAVNNEEQIMSISGLVRTRDINSQNEVDSSKIASMRIDYFGRGTVGSAQYGGWLSNLLRILWPF